jgi:hypothetical protein
MRAIVTATSLHGGTITLYPDSVKAENTAERLRMEGYKNISIEYPKEENNENILHEKER